MFYQPYIMLFLAYILTTPASGAAITNAVATVEGYSINEMMFSGTIANHDIQMNGTIQDVYAYLQSIEPSFIIPNNTASEIKGLHSRNKNPPPICCPIAGQNWDVASDDTIHGGIDYLTHLTNGNARCGVGARSCA
ncbi:hypothetical protein EG329_002570 [Mollisiaceae sp. DMI_Dod_QoI]|nr:hypothetical protein EG329_002570 [Helotiales sp. DMI_Dod_QoI]